MTASDLADLIVVGAGPAGRALAHRAVAAGLRTVVVDPAPHTPWTATIGMFGDDLPPWLDSGVVVARSDWFTVFTPRRRTVPRGYCVLSAARLQRALSLDGADVVESYADQVTGATVRLSDGTTLRARCVIDARGGSAAPTAPRQTAFGAFCRLPDDEAAPAPEMVLMDWRASPAGSPSFNYRVPVGDGLLLVEETCLAGRPAIGVGELRERATSWLDRRLPEAEVSADVETVDFPLAAPGRPWRRSPGAATRFGAAGGLMHPATGYSIAESLRSVDDVVEALLDGRDPGSALWPRRARIAHLLRLAGLEALLGMDSAALTRFFDCFFTLDVERQRAYLSHRDDPAGIARAMWAVFARLPLRLKRQVAVASVVAGRRPLQR
ncbi:MAG: lycopene cyclase family protein [Gordonia sp. (in: high G+C Gram-positive bacteria)]